MHPKIRYNPKICYMLCALYQGSTVLRKSTYLNKLKIVFTYKMKNSQTVKFTDENNSRLFFFLILKASLKRIIMEIGYIINHIVILLIVCYVYSEMKSDLLHSL